jgi:hypothetical protein
MKLSSSFLEQVPDRTKIVMGCETPAAVLHGRVDN